MKNKDLSNLFLRRNTFVVGSSGSGLTRCMDFSPEVINEVNEILKALKETEKEYLNGKNQGK